MFRGLDLRPSTGGRLREENLHCEFVRDRRLALFNGPTRVVSFKYRPLYPMNGGGGGSVRALRPVWTVRKRDKVSCL